MATLASSRSQTLPRLLIRAVPEGAEVPTDAEDLAESVHRAVAGSWVRELRLEGSVDPGIAASAVTLARAAGRLLRLPAEMSRTDLPPSLDGEEWRRDRDGWRLRRRPRPLRARALKRALDVIGAAIGLIVLAPLMLVLAIAVKLDSAGPILYEWRVLGRDGRPFSGYKFRSMVVGADSMKEQMLALNEMTGPAFKMADDPRVTRLGRFLRKYSLDELPQLWSVLRGDMSLVGPRPPSPEEYRGFELWQMRKLSVTPGITCLWQVNGRNLITDFREWVRLDLDYIDHWSFGLDLQILIRTAGAVVRGTGR